MEVTITGQRNGARFLGFNLADGEERKLDLNPRQIPLLKEAVDRGDITVSSKDPRVTF